LEQVAAIGLIKAIDGFDPGLGYAVASYAVPTIDGELKRHFRDCTWAVHVPRSGKQNRAAQLSSRCTTKRKDAGTPSETDTVFHLKQHGRTS